MADTTEYNMLFKLSAQLGKDYNTTFAAAQKTLTETQKEINELNKKQSEINGYVKQQQAVEATTRKLTDLQTQYDNIQKEISETEGFSSSLENKLVEKQRAIDKTNISLQQQTTKLDQMGNALESTGVDTNNLTAESEKLTVQMDELAQKQQDAANKASEYGTVGVNSFEAVGSALVSAGIASGLKKIYELYGDCVSGAMSFADEIGTNSVLYGISQEKLQSYYYAAELVDTSVDTITSTMARNIRSMNSAREGTGDYTKAYETLGVAVADADGQLRDSEDVYWEVIDALGGMDNATERDALAMEILGRNAQSLNTLIAAGSVTMNEYAEEARNAGYIMSDETLTACQNLDDEGQRLKNNTMALKNTIGAAFAPELKELAKIANGILTSITDFAEKNPVIVKSLVAIGLEVATIIGLYYGYQTAKKAMNAIRMVSAALKAKETVATVAGTAATIAETTATTSATVAQTGLNAAMSANPIGILILAMAALTVGVVAYTQAMSESSDETANLTAASKAQYDEIQALKGEYDNACDVYGSTSYEAQSLQWQVDELTQSYEDQKQTLEEYNAAVEEANKRYDDMVDKHSKSAQEVEYETASISSLVTKLTQLTQETSNTAAEKEEILAIIKALNEEIPDLSLSYSDLTGSMNKTIDTVKALAQSEIINRKYSTYQEDLIEKMEEQSNLQEEMTALTNNQTAAEEALAEAQMNLAEATDYANSQPVGSPNGYEATQRENFIRKYKQELQAAQDEYNKVTQDVFNKQADMTENQAAIDAYAEKMANLVYVVPEEHKNDKDARIVARAIEYVKRGYVDATKAAEYFNISEQVLNDTIAENEAYDENLAKAVESVKDGYLEACQAAELFGLDIAEIEVAYTVDKINSLKEAYDEAKTSAQESIEGQYKLWDTAAVVITTSVDSINTALTTQTSYWSDYNTDLSNLLNRTGDIEGLSDIIATFADGSADSVNAIAGMAAASDEELAKMVANWQEVKKQQEDASNAIAEIKAGYGDELQDMEDKLDTAVESLNLDKEAETAAKATVDAYAQAIRDGTDDAVSAAEELKSLVAKALLDTGISVETNSANGTAMPEIPNRIVGPVPLDTFLKNIGGYANGTNSANAGWRLAGENGPELIDFNGGERVYTAAETADVLGGSVSVTVAPQITIEGNADREQMQEATEILIAEMFAALEEAGIDAKRGAYK